MADPRGFLKHGRSPPAKRPTDERIRDWGEVETRLPAGELERQASRCMDCGIPFCHQGCPLGNEIPAWNELVHLDRWREALDRLHATNNFPEFTGKTCPAPCESSCVLAVNDDAVTIKQVEREIADRGWAEGWIPPEPPAEPTGKRVAVVGSGPAGLAAAQQLARAGHAVTVFERDDRPGGLLRYGIPDFKLEKWNVERRVEQMRAEGVVFRTGVEVGVHVTAEELRGEHDAVLLAVGAQRPRDLPVPGRELEGVHFAMEYLTQQNRVGAGDAVPAAERVSAEGKRVLILGGGDTGADCLGTAHRQRAASVHHFHYKPAPPDERTPDMLPWPWWPMTLQPSSSHEEGGERGWSVVTKAFTGDAAGRVRAMRGVEVEWVPGEDGRRVMQERPGTEFTMDVDLVLLAIGFTGVEDSPLFGGLGVERTARGTVAHDDRFRTGAPGVYACGDATRGPSLVVWAIWEGREAAAALDAELRGQRRLPSVPNAHPL